MKKNKYVLLGLSGLLFWFLETAYFGFNMQPESNIERFMDYTAVILMTWGIVGDVFSNLTITKSTNINTQHIDFYDHRELETTKGSSKA